MIRKLNNLIQHKADFSKQGIGQAFQRVSRCLADAPVEGLGLVAQHIAGFPRLGSLGNADRNRKRVVGIVFRRGHRQADNQRRACVESTLGKNNERMPVAHLPSGLRVAIDPDDVLPIGNPSRYGLGRYQRSAPFGAVTMTSPPWRAGSKRASR